MQWLIQHVKLNCILDLSLKKRMLFQVTKEFCSVLLSSWLMFREQTAICSFIGRDTWLDGWQTALAYAQVWPWVSAELSLYGWKASPRVSTRRCIMTNAYIKRSWAQKVVCLFPGRTSKQEIKNKRLRFFSREAIKPRLVGALRQRSYNRRYVVPQWHS